MQAPTQTRLAGVGRLLTAGRAGLVTASAYPADSGSGLTPATFNAPADGSPLYVDMLEAGYTGGPWPSEYSQQAYPRDGAGAYSLSGGEPPLRYYVQAARFVVEPVIFNLTGRYGVRVLTPDGAGVVLPRTVHPTAYDPVSITLPGLGNYLIELSYFDGTVALDGLILYRFP